MGIVHRIGKMYVLCEEKSFSEFFPSETAKLFIKDHHSFGSIALTQRLEFYLQFKHQKMTVVKIATRASMRDQRSTF